MFADDAAAAPAIGAGGDHAEHPAKTLLGNAALSAALHADHRLTARLRAASLCTPRRRPAARIRSFSRTRWRLRSASARPAFPDQTRAGPRRRPRPRRRRRRPGRRRPRRRCRRTSRRCPRRPCARSRAVPVTPCMAELVVTSALLLVGQNLVSLGALLEHDLRFGLVRVVAVGVILHRQAAIGALDLLAVGRAGHAQHLVIIAFGRCHASFPTLAALTRPVASNGSMTLVEHGPSSEGTGGKR